MLFPILILVNKLAVGLIALELKVHQSVCYYHSLDVDLIPVFTVTSLALLFFKLFEAVSADKSLTAATLDRVSDNVAAGETFEYLTEVLVR